jgi:hypothetical protein
MIQKIISGGQTGADRMALDWAIWHRIPHGGWCPKGRKAEDGPIGSKYLLKETPTSNYAQRTEWNVRDSDGTVIFSLAPALTGGSKKTIKFAIKHKKPWRHISRGGNMTHPTHWCSSFPITGLRHATSPGREQARSRRSLPS